MNSSKVTVKHGLTLLSGGKTGDTDHREAKPPYGGGDDGGSGMDDLRKRIERTEQNIEQIKIDLATLTTRSESFASKSALDTLITRSENFATKADFQTVRTEIQAVRTEIQTAISGQTKWIAATIIGTTAIALAVARFLFV